MSLPTIHTLKKKPEEVTREDLLMAIQADLPLAYEAMHSYVKALHGNGRELHNSDPNSELGKQLTRVCAGTVLRSTIEQHFGIHIGFLNCCGVIVSKTPEGAIPSIADQVRNQNGDWASPDC